MHLEIPTSSSRMTSCVSEQAPPPNNQITEGVLQIYHTLQAALRPVRHDSAPGGVAPRLGCKLFLAPSKGCSPMTRGSGTVSDHYTHLRSEAIVRNNQMGQSRQQPLGCVVPQRCRAVPSGLGAGKPSLPLAYLHRVHCRKG